MLMTAYSAAVLLIASTLMISLKHDGYLDLAWGFVFVPVWLVFSILLMFTCFMCPGFMDAKIRMQRQAFLMFVYILSITAMSAIVAVKLDGGISGSWLVLMTPVWIALGFHILSLVLHTIRNGL